MAGLIFVLTGQVEQRALQEIDAWRDKLTARRARLQKKAKAAKDDKKTDVGDTVWRGKHAQTAPAREPESKKKKKAKDPQPKPLGALPRDFADLIEEIGEGRVVGQYELAPKVAYARFVTGDAEGSSDLQSVLIRLEESGPKFTARPLPLLDEERGIPNTGIEFRKDPEFFAAYLVEADATLAKEIGKWLSRDLRELLRDHGEAWLCVRGRTMALTVYGPIREEKITALVELADVFVAEHGAEDGPSLFGESERAGASDDGDDADDEDAT